jgi:hypothetical protein
MALWRFSDYVTTGGQNLIQAWCSAQDAAVRANFDATVLLLKGTADWTSEHVDEFDLLTGQHAGLGELRFHVEVARRGMRAYKRRFRPVGIYLPDQHHFVFILGCEKSGRIYTPPRAFDIALQHKLAFEQGLGSLHEHL